MSESNIERTHNRDLTWSKWMRDPDRRTYGCAQLRSCDVDPSLVCHQCGFIALIEETKLPDGKAASYITMLARDAGISSFLAYMFTFDDIMYVRLINTQTGKEYPPMTREQNKVFWENFHLDHVNNGHKSRG